MHCRRVQVENILEVVFGIQHIIDISIIKWFESNRLG